MEGGWANFPEVGTTAYFNEHFDLSVKLPAKVGWGTFLNYGAVVLFTTTFQNR